MARFKPVLRDVEILIRQKQPLEVFYKKKLLLKISQYSQENTCVELYWKRDPNTAVFLWILRDFWEHLFSRTSANDCFCKAGCRLVQYIVFNILRKIVHNLLANVNGFIRYYAKFKTTSAGRCSQYSLIFLKSNVVWFELSISQYSFVLYLASCNLITIYIEN